MPTAKKRFGQHFLCDTSIIDAIVSRFKPKAESEVIEIGPGQGAITGPLLDAGVHLTAVELDRDMQATLELRFGTRPNFNLVSQDILKTDIQSLTGSGPARIIGNLPYNISSPILFHLLDALPFIEDMYFMLQKEVAERVVAAPGSRTYGKPSVLIQRLCEARMDLIIPPTAFKPPPRVMSAMLKLRPRSASLGGPVDESIFGGLVSAAFAQRRKTLRNALRQFVTPEQMEHVGIAPIQRAETVPVEAFVRLAQSLSGT